MYSQTTGPSSGPSVRVRSWSPKGGSFGWLLMVPGIALIIFSVAILIWPELLAYLVAGGLLLLGVALTGWGWTAYRAGRRRAKSQTVVQYRVQ